jgi:hypothetical protein
LCLVLWHSSNGWKNYFQNELQNHDYTNAKKSMDLLCIKTYC